MMQKGAKVVYGREKEFTYLVTAVKRPKADDWSRSAPKFFLPVHGEHRMLVKRARQAQSMDIPPENALFKGDVVEVSESGICVAGKVKLELNWVDTSGSGMVSGKVLKGRQHLADKKASLQWRRPWLEWQADDDRAISARCNLNRSNAK